MHLTKWKIKKDFFCFLLWFFFVLFCYFFALNTPPMELAVDEVRSFRCTVGSGQDGGWATANDGLMSCIDRILEGHNHDLIVLKLKSNKQKKRQESEWTTLQDASRRICHTRNWTCFNAYKTSSKYKLKSSQLPTNAPFTARWINTMLKFISKWYATQKASQQKRTSAVFFG